MYKAISIAAFVTVHLSEIQISIFRTSEHYKAPSLSMRSEANIEICIYDRCTVTNAAIDIALYMGIAFVIFCMAFFIPHLNL